MREDWKSLSMSWNYMREDWKSMSLPERVCRVLEAMAAETHADECTLDAVMVYRFTHIANGSCHHPDWLKEFEAAEAEAKLAYYTSPVERELAEQLLAAGLVRAART
jgi:hypothetical protein